ncbi:MAG: hypothetical protein ABGX83_05270 [Nitrospira sp.]
MGGSKGQSTTTIDNWPKFLEGDPLEGDPLLQNGIPGTRERYMEAMSVDARFRNDAILRFFTARPRVLGLDPDEAGAFVTLVNRGKIGNTTITKGRALVKDVLDSKYLNGTEAKFVAVNGNANTKSITAFTDDIEPKIGGSLYIIGDPHPTPANIAKSLVSGSSSKYRSRMDAEMFYKNYAYERREQVGALAHALEYSDQEMADAETVRRVGLYAREHSQLILEDIFDRNQEHDIDLAKNVETMGNAVRTMTGTYEARTQPYHTPGKGGAIMGGAATGAALGMAGGPMGVVAGAVIGGVLGGIAGG